jgi:hypothetical protein
MTTGKLTAWTLEDFQTSLDKLKAEDFMVCIQVWGCNVPDAIATTVGDVSVLPPEGIISEVRGVITELSANMGTRDCRSGPDAGMQSCRSKRRQNTPHKTHTPTTHTTHTHTQTHTQCLTPRERPQTWALVP